MVDIEMCDCSKVVVIVVFVVVAGSIERSNYNRIPEVKNDHVLYI